MIPTYNCVDAIEASVRQLHQFVQGHPDWRVLFVCDGCSDGTEVRLHELLNNLHPALQMHAYPVNRGKGNALRVGLSQAAEPYLFFTDVDLAYPPEEALKLLKLLEGGADLAVANRTDPASRFIISPAYFPRIYKRHLMSRAFNVFLRCMLPIRILDTQAGLKGLTLAAWKKLQDQMTSNGFFFDVELLTLAGEHHLTVAQTPVVFSYVDPSTVRMVNHGWHMGVQTFRLRARLKRERRLRQANDPVPAPSTRA